MLRHLAGFALAAALVLPAAPRHAAAADAREEKACVTVINLTQEKARVFSKTGSLTYFTAKPRSVERFCCGAAPGLCFDKPDGTSKVKVVSLDPNGMDEWSGATCNPVRIAPGQALVVEPDLDGSHIVCRIAEPGEVVVRFEEVDVNGDGKMDRGEASVLNLDVTVFEALDVNGDGALDRAEYEGFWSRINILRGVSF